MESRKGTYQGLNKIRVNIEDNSHLSEYFGVVDFPKYLAGGKNSLSFNGSTFLKERSPIEIEILDVNGNPVYYETGKTGDTVFYKDGDSFVISIWVDKNTPIGMGKVYMVGTTVKNQTVRWSRNININYKEKNTSKIRFYRTPKLEIIPILSDVVEYSDDEIISVSGSSYGEFVPSSNRYIQSEQESRKNPKYRILSTSGTDFSSLMVGENIVLTNITASSGKIDDNFVSQVGEVINSSELILKDVFVNKNTNNVENIINCNFSTSYISIPQESVQQIEGFTFQSSLARISLSNIETFTGEIKKIKFYKKSFNTNSDFLLAADINLTDNEILIDDNTSNRYLSNIGFFKSQTIVDNYWISNKEYITLTTSSTNIIDGVQINGNFSGSSDEYIIVKDNTTYPIRSSSYVPFDSTYYDQTGESWDSNLIRLYPDSDYTFKTKIYVDRLDDSVVSDIVFYLTGSHLGFSSSINYDGSKMVIGSASFGAGVNKTFKEIENDFYLNSDFYGTLVINPKTDGYTVSNVSIKPKIKYPYSMDTFTTKISFPLETNNEKFIISARLFDMDGNDSRTVIEDTATFDPIGISLLKSASVSIVLDTTVASASYAATASYIQWENVDGAPTSSEYAVSSSNATTAFHADVSDISLYALDAGTSSYAGTASYLDGTASYANTALTASYLIGASLTASYVSWSNIDGVPDFVLESETSSMSVLYSVSSSDAVNAFHASVSDVSLYALNAGTASYLVGFDNLTASSVEWDDVLNKPVGLISSSQQFTSDDDVTFGNITASNISTDYLETINAYVSGNLVVDGTIIADELYINYVSSSILYKSGSSKFGDTFDDTHQFTGSVSISGSLNVNGNKVIVDGDIVTQSISASEAVHSFHASVSDVSLYAHNAGTASYIDASNIENLPDFVLESETGSMSVLSSSYSLTASYALTSEPQETASYSIRSKYAVSSSDAVNAFHASIADISLYSQDAGTASYIDSSNIDNLPDFVLESETSSMTVLSSSYSVSSSHTITSDTASHVLWENISGSPDFVLENETGSMSVLYATSASDAVNAFHASVSDISLYSHNAGTASYIDYSNVDNHPDFVLESETGSMSVLSASYSISSSHSQTASNVSWENISGSPDFVLESETSSMSALYATSASDAVNSFHSNISDVALYSHDAGTASYVSWSQVDDVPDFVLESETGSMTVLSSSFSVSSSYSHLTATASYVSWSNVDNVPDFVLESETSSMSVLYAISASDAVNAFHANISDVSLYSLNAGTSSYVDFDNVDNVPDFVLESETGSMSVSSASFSETSSYSTTSSYSVSSSHSYLSETSSYVSWSNVDNVPDFVLESETSSMSVLYSVSSSDAVNAFHASVSDISLYAHDAGTASYVDFDNVDNVPDFVLESETGSMSVSSASYSTTSSYSVSSSYAELSTTASYVSWSNVDNVPDFVLESETGSMSVLSSSYSNSSSFSRYSSESETSFQSQISDISLFSYESVSSSISVDSFHSSVSDISLYSHDAGTASYINWNDVDDVPDFVLESETSSMSVSSASYSFSASYLIGASDTASYVSWSNVDGVPDFVLESETSSMSVLSSSFSLTASYLGNSTYFVDPDSNNNRAAKLAGYIEFSNGAVGYDISGEEFGLLGNEDDYIAVKLPNGDYSYGGNFPLSVVGSLVISNGNMIAGGDITGSKYIKAISGFVGDLQGTASYSISASDAINAFHASVSDISLYAHDAGTASYVDFDDVDNVPYFLLESETSSMSVSSASYSTTSSYSISSSYSITASYSVSSSYSISSSYSELSSTASYVSWSNVDNVPDFVLESETSSLFVSSSVFSLTASYINGLVNGTSSHAISASDAVNAFHVDVSDIALYSHNAGTASYALSASYLIGQPDTASWAENSVTASYSLFALTASYLEGVAEGTSSWAETASWAENAITASHALSLVDDLDINANSVNVGIVSLLKNQFSLNDGGLEDGNGNYIAGYLGDSNSYVFASGVITFSVPEQKCIIFTNTEITGSLNVKNSVTASGFLGDVNGTASYAISASDSIYGFFAESTSMSLYSLDAGSASYATTASYLIGFTNNTSSWAENAVTASHALSLTSGLDIFANSVTVSESVLTYDVGGFNRSGLKTIGGNDIATSVKNGEKYWYANSYIEYDSLANFINFYAPVSLAGYSITASFLQGTSSWAISASNVNDGTLTISGGPGISGNHIFTANQSSSTNAVLSVDNNTLSTISGQPSFFSVLDTSFPTKATGRVSSSNINLSIFNDDLGIVVQSQTSSMTVLSSSFASTASYIDGLINGTASHAISSSDSIYSFYAEEAYMSLYALDAGSASYALSASYLIGQPDTASWAENAVTASHALSLVDDLDIKANSVNVGIVSLLKNQFTLNDGGLEDGNGGYVVGYFGDSNSYVFGTGAMVFSVPQNKVVIQYTTDITGSLNVKNSVTASGFLGDVNGTASYAISASDAEYSFFAEHSSMSLYALDAGSASYATTASYLIGFVNNTSSWAENAVTASYAWVAESASNVTWNDVNNVPDTLQLTSSWAENSLTASYLRTGNFYVDPDGPLSVLSGSMTVRGLTCNGQLSVNGVHGMTISDNATITFTPGSGLPKLQLSASGEDLYLKKFAGSNFIDGGSLHGIFTGSLFGTASYAISASDSIYGFFAESTSMSLYSLDAGSASYAVTASYAQYALTVSGGVDNSVSSSYAETASIAYSASSVAWNDVYGSPDFVETSQTSSMTVDSSSWTEFAVTSSQMSISGSNIVAYISNDNSGSFIIEGNEGQLFSVVDNMSGSIFSVNDISGIPSIEVFDTGEIRLAEFGGNVGIGIDNPQNTLVVSGGIHSVGSVTASVFLGDLIGTSSWAENFVGFNGFSSSVSIRVSDLENFSSSLDATFATDIELSNVSASLALDKVNNSQTSSMFVSSSIFASTASYINGLVNGTASYAISASDAEYSFFAEHSSMSLYALDAGSASYVSWSNVDDVPDFVLRNETSSMFVSHSMSSNTSSYAVSASHLIGQPATSSWSINSLTSSYLGTSTYFVDPDNDIQSANLAGVIAISNPSGGYLGYDILSTGEFGLLSSIGEYIALKFPGDTYYYANGALSVVNGTVIGSGEIVADGGFVGDLQGTASYAISASDSFNTFFAEVSSMSLYAHDAGTSSYVDWLNVSNVPNLILSSQTSSMVVDSASYATTASYLIGFENNTSSWSENAISSSYSSYAESASSINWNDINDIPNLISPLQTSSMTVLSSSYSTTASISNNSLTASYLGNSTYFVDPDSNNGRSAKLDGYIEFSNGIVGYDILGDEFGLLGNEDDYIAVKLVNGDYVYADEALSVVNGDITGSKYIKAVSGFVGDLQGTASYAISASDSIYGFFAESTSMSLYSLDAGSASYAVTASYVMGGTGTAETASYLGDSTYYVDPNGPDNSANLLGDVTVSGSVNISGSLFALSKSFRIKHPSKLGMTLQHGVLEGPEHAVYIRGKVGGDNSTIDLPDFWEGLIDPETITVQLTPYGHTLTPSVKEIDWDNKIIHLFYHSTPCFYFIQATRIDIPQLIVEEK